MQNINSTASKLSVLKQLCNLIPGHALSKLVREHDSQNDARSFSHWSHVVTLIALKRSAIKPTLDTLRSSSPIGSASAAPRHAVGAFQCPLHGA